MSTETKTDKKVAKPVTNEQLLEAIEQTRIMFRSQLDEIGLKLESSCLQPATVKRPIVKKAAEATEKKAVKPPANALYFFRAMFAKDDKSVANFFTADDIKKAEENCTKIKSKSTDYEKKLAYGAQIYSGFTDAKKKQIKGVFEIWKKEQEQANIKTVEVENATDDEKKDEKKDA